MALPSSVRSSQLPTEPGALMKTKGGSGLDGECTVTHWADDVRNAPICNRGNNVSRENGEEIEFERGKLINSGSFVHWAG